MSGRAASTTGRAGRRDGGYITVVVLTFAGLMAALVAATLNVARPSIGQALVNVDDMQADALLEAGVAAAGFALYGGNKPSMDVNGLFLPMQTGTVTVTVTTEGGRIDLNGAPPVLLTRLYREVGTGALAPPQFTSLILDWRDRDNKARRRGGEEDEYSSRGLDYGPRNGPFLALEELMLLPGMTVADYEALTPYLTVYNPFGEIEPAGAPIPVLMAVPDMSGADATAIREAFADPDAKRGELNRAIRPYRRYLTIRGDDVFRVAVEARLNNGYTKTAEAVLMAGFRQEPYYKLSWTVRSAPEPET